VKSGLASAASTCASAVAARVAGGLHRHARPQQRIDGLHAQYEHSCAAPGEEEL